MRNTPVLYAIHVGRRIREKWFYKGKIKIQRSKAKEVLMQNNIKIYEVNDLDPPSPVIKYADPLVPEDLPLDENHPDWKAEKCYIYKDVDVLVEGLDQARKLTNTVEISQLPTSLLDSEAKLKLSDVIHDQAQKKIMQSHIFDAQQEKLPKRWDPERLFFNLPRVYGITDVRKNKLLLNNLVQLCEQHYCNLDKSTVNDGLFIYPMRAFNKLIQFEVTGELIIRSKNGLCVPQEQDSVERKPVPDTSPVDCTISIKPYNFYVEQDFFSLDHTKFPYVHTLFLSFNRTQVKNLFEEPVTDTQMIARNLLKGFSVASSQARALYGKNENELKEPIVIQIVMTDGRLFHFSVFQLNSLDVESEHAKKNIYWNSELIPLFDVCEYVNGSPTLKGYNPDIMKRIVAFYENK